jgi:hypothetical protein
VVVEARNFSACFHSVGFSHWDTLVALL